MSQSFRIATLAVAASLTLGAPLAFAAGTHQDASIHRVAMKSAATPMVGGAPMYPDRTIVENAGTATNLSTLVAAVKEAGLASTLSGKGPFTVFAPTNKAFAKLPKATVANLMKPENRDKLAAILEYHVVPGAITSRQLTADIRKGGGKAHLTTVEGKTLTVEKHNGGLRIEDQAGHRTTIEQSDVMQSNGVVYVIGSVLSPS